jgi:8-oxo-dGTP pyrophosphatase MutT (NUDIX family)
MHWPERRMGAAAVVLDSRGRVLLVRHTYGRLNWELPGGASEHGESVVDTALRELHEETGLRATADRLTGVYYEPEIDAHHFVFGCTAETTAEPAPASAEISDCAYWLAPDLPRPISTFTIRRIADALSDSPPLLVTVVPQREWLD